MNASERQAIDLKKRGMIYFVRKSKFLSKLSGDLIPDFHPAFGYGQNQGVARLVMGQCLGKPFPGILSVFKHGPLSPGYFYHRRGFAFNIARNSDFSIKLEFASFRNKVLPFLLECPKKDNQKLDFLRRII